MEPRNIVEMNIAAGKLKKGDKLTRIWIDDMMATTNMITVLFQRINPDGIVFKKIDVVKDNDSEYVWVWDKINSSLLLRDTQLSFTVDTTTRMFRGNALFNLVSNLSAETVRQDLDHNTLNGLSRHFRSRALLWKHDDNGSGDIGNVLYVDELNRNHAVIERMIRNN